MWSLAESRPPPPLKILDFLGALAFLFGMMLAGLAVAVGLWNIALLAGASDELMHYLYLPIGVAAVFACGLAGKLAHRGIAKLL